MAAKKQKVVRTKVRMLSYANNQPHAPLMLEGAVTIPNVPRPNKPGRPKKQKPDDWLQLVHSALADIDPRGDNEEVTVAMCIVSAAMDCRSAGILLTAAQLYERGVAIAERDRPEEQDAEEEG